MGLALTTPGHAAQPDASELYKRIERLGRVGSVLYVAAHPDDENTRLLAWLVNNQGLRTTYLSMTRGGGGQNLIGGEQSELLGVIRTGELMAARALDGAEQRFARTRDFGYSKSAKETLEIWGREQALADMVRTIREVRPDVIFTRFRPQGRNHGHHTASAQLAEEAFAAAADPQRFPEQLKEGLSVWKTDRLIHNQSHWRLRRMKNPDLSKFIQLDVGGFDPLLGVSYGEIAAASRTMHKSQGFGAAVERGPIPEYFEPVAGTRPKDHVFEGLTFGWARYKGTAAVDKAHRRVLERFDPRRPADSIGDLVELRRQIDALRLPAEGAHWKARKLAELDEILVAAAGLWVEARAERGTVVPGDKLKVEVHLLNRASKEVQVMGATDPNGEPLSWRGPLKKHDLVKRALTVDVYRSAPPSTPFWLAKTPTAAAYTIEDPALIVRPEGPAPLSLRVKVAIGRQTLELTRPLVHVWTDRVRGELTRQVEIVPPVTAKLDRRVVVAPGSAPVSVGLTLEAHAEDLVGMAKVIVPAGWKVSPESVAFDTTQGGPVHRAALKLTPGPGAKPGQLKIDVAAGGWYRGSHDRVEIDYEHLPLRGVLRPAEAKLVPVDVRPAKGRRLAYVQGSGDEVAAALRLIGYEVVELEPDELAKADLKRFHAVIFGIRAFNKHPQLHRQHERLMRWVEGGGTLIVQYNTQSSWGRLKGPLGPWPFEIARERVTDETAPITARPSDHPLVTRPHRLTAADFDGWVQERGLYFAKTWDERYQTPLRMNDPGEEPLAGSTLVGNHGKGVFIYTGVSFFRQLPAGVPGAFRLLANMVEHAAAR